jgi:hypothetical protein
VNCVIACYVGDPEAGIPADDGGLPACFALCAGADGGGYGGAGPQGEGQTLITVLGTTCMSTCAQ